MVFEIKDDNDNTYKGYIATPDRRWQAKSFAEVMKILTSMASRDIL